jgi:hypothetical protein
VGALIIVSALTALACLLLLWCCCKVAAWSDRRMYLSDVRQGTDAGPVIAHEADKCSISGNTDPVSPTGNTSAEGIAPSGATAPDAPSCPRCSTPRPFGPGSIEFEDEGSELYYQCRRCGHLYFGRDLPPGRCWGIGA